MLAVWSSFQDDDLPVRPHGANRRGRSVLEQMIHQCVSENLWFRDKLGIDVSAPPLPARETRIDFLERYAEDSGRRSAALGATDDEWWEAVVPFFQTRRSRAWIVVRRVARTAHHRGQQAAMLRMLGRSLHSTYGPTADTGGLMQHRAPTIYPYPDADALLRGERAGGRKAALPGPGGHPVTERG